MATKSQISSAVDARFAVASDTAKLRIKRGDLAASVVYEPRLRRLRIELFSGVGVSVPVRKIQGLEHASPAIIKTVKITGKGYGLVWPGLDLDVSVSDLVAGLFGTRAWMRALARQGGRATSSAKAAAARINGKKGGRPRKNSPLEATAELWDRQIEADAKAGRLESLSARARSSHAMGKTSKI